MMEITIRLAKPADAPDMAEVIIRSWEAAYRGIVPDDYIWEKNATRLEFYQRTITDENKTFYVIQADGSTVGVMSFGEPGDETKRASLHELWSLYLHPERQRRGIGTQAMDFVLAEARRLGKKELLVWVLEDNVNAIKFYTKCGFSPDGGERFWEYGKRLRGISMRREI